jgi:hypothetical protein
MALVSVMLLFEIFENYTFSYNTKTRPVIYLFIVGLSILFFYEFINYYRDWMFSI